MILSKKKKYDPTKVTTIELINKAKTIIGQHCELMGICGDFESVIITDILDVSFRHRSDGQREVKMATDNNFYSSAWWEEETIMNWKYNKIE